MLEIRNLTKIYKPKKGLPVVALNNISLKLPSKGMVFILGKSGSGKSTLLNVLGGLDSFTSGEVYIKGELAKEFKQKHYDSYRNTYIGFIFQEYNILKDFTVGANIGLAIELQGRQAEDNEINEILKKVDLEGYGQRKPNELSGGQMQRVAIARALVKNPDIIMADEPTGALDSKTGEAIFNTLKELSKDKLVLIVSHDRDFSERYADRIIELADGNIISDVTLTDKTINDNESTQDEAQEENKSNISFLDHNIEIKRGYQLTEEDRILINDYLLKHKEDEEDINVVLAKTNNKKTIRKEKVIKDTDIDSIEMDNSGFHLIKSKLSLKNSFKIGASGLAYKKVKLIFTILLSFVAFSLFGLADTIASYNYINSTADSIVDSNINYASFSKREQKTWSDNTHFYKNINMKEEDVKELREISGVLVNGVYDVELSYSDTKVSDKKNEDNYNEIYDNTFYGFSELTQEVITDRKYKLLGGRLPDGSKDEFVITKFVFDSYVGFNFREFDLDGETYTDYKINDINDILGKKYVFDNTYFEIVGVVDTNFDYDRFASLLEPQGDNYNILYWALYLELMTLKSYSDIALCYGGPGFVKRYATDHRVMFTGINDNTLILTKGETEDYPYVNRMTRLGETDFNVFWFDGEKEKLAANEFVVSLGFLSQIIECYGDLTAFNYQKYNKVYTIEDNEYKIFHFIDVSDIESFVYQIGQIAILDYTLKYIQDNYEMIRTIYPEKDMEEIINETYNKFSNLCLYDYNYVHQLAAKIIGEIYLETVQDKNLQYQFVDYYNESVTTGGEFKIVGVTSYNCIENMPMLDFASSKADGSGVDFERYYYNETYIVANDTFFNLYTNEDPDAYYGFALGKMPESKKDIKKILLNCDDYEEKYTAKNYYQLQNNVIDEMTYINYLLYELKQVFLYVGLAFALFSSLLLSNFIATSISYKKQEIGILRAIGSRSNDVFKIFYSEAFIIAMINYVISLIATIGLSALINYALRSETTIQVTCLSFGIRQVFVLLFLCLFVSFVASFFPVKAIARKKPIDAIRNR